MRRASKNLVSGSIVLELYGVAYMEARKGHSGRKGVCLDRVIQHKQVYF